MGRKRMETVTSKRPARPRTARKSPGTSRAKRVKKSPGTSAETVTPVPEIRMFRLRELQAAPYNGKTISDEALDGLAASIAAFGCVEPIVVNVRNKRPRVIGGHQRLKALARLGADEVLCAAVDVPPGKERLLNIALNNPEIQGRFTADIAGQLAALQENLKTKALATTLRLAQLKARIEKQAVETKPAKKKSTVVDIKVTHQCPQCGHTW